jgi:CRISPR/Cas system CSM-associated protein Csm4 (group 5 of RAMP superfamily)
MNPAFVVRFRPRGPWRIGVDSGARDRVDRIFHSDAVFSAVSLAMLRLGRMEEWLAATARAAGEPAVRFGSLFPFLDDILFVPPPRGLWPPPPSAKVRWSNARFVPLAVVRDLVADKAIRDNRWFLDGDSGCLLAAEPGERSGPFRVALRSHAAVDRPTGAAVEVHRTACLEFAEGAGLWGAVSFADEDARARWSAAVQTAFRVLADTGFGGERSLGWGRSEQPEFVEGTLPELILPARPSVASVPAPPVIEPLRAPAATVAEPEAAAAAPAPEPAGFKPEPIEPVEFTAEAEPGAAIEPAREAEPATEVAAEAIAEPAVESAPAPAPEPAAESAPKAIAEPAVVESAAAPASPAEPSPESTGPVAEIEPAPASPATEPPLAPAAAPSPAPKPRETGYWLLSLYSPAPEDAIDWQRGWYTLAERAGRIDSPARAGDSKKLLRMVEEGSVLVARSAPRGAAPDVAPDGFPHPVFRCGFALAVPIAVRGDR